MQIIGLYILEYFYAHLLVGFTPLVNCLLVFWNVDQSFGGLGNQLYRYKPNSTTIFEKFYKKFPTYSTLNSLQRR